MNPVPLFLIIVTLPLLLGSVCHAELRTWTSIVGTKVEAELVSQTSDQVTLKTKAGKTLKLPVNKLSKADQDYIRDANPLKSVSLECSKLVQRVGYSFEKESFVTKKQDADLWLYFDEDDCSGGAIFGNRDRKGYIFIPSKRNFSEISLDNIPTHESTKIGFRPIGKGFEGMPFWIKTISGRFVLAVIKKVQPAVFTDFASGAKAKVELEWIWQAATETKPELNGVHFDMTELREGRRYLKSSDLPYTGKAFMFYKSGKKRTEGNWKDGKKEGLVTSWNENGEKDQESNYKNGKLDGLMIMWHSNVQKMTQQQYEDGKLISRKYWNRKGEPVDSFDEAVAK